MRPRRRALRAHPALAAAFRRYRDVYARSAAFIRRPPPDCRGVHVAPERHLRTNRTTRNLRALEADYQYGRLAGARAIRAWAEQDAAAAQPAAAL